MGLTSVGQIEKKTQQRVVALFRDTLGYAYLGNWIDQEGNHNIEPDRLRAWLKTRRQPYREYARSASDPALRQGALDYKKHLAQIAELTKQATDPGGGAAYPGAVDTPAKRALYNNLGKDEALALAVDQAVQGSRQDGWRGNPIKVRHHRGPSIGGGGAQGH